MKTIINDSLKNNGFFTGRMISYSKTSYRERYPNNKVIFNANIFTKNSKVWWGDLDLTKDEEALRKVATECEEVLYVLSELDGRFENEEQSFSEIKKKSIAIISPHQTVFDLL